MTNHGILFADIKKYAGDFRRPNAAGEREMSLLAYDVCNALLESDSGLCRFIATTVQIKLRVIRERVYCYTVLGRYCV